MLVSAGLGNDFKFCMKIDSHSIVPVLDNDGLSCFNSENILTAAN